MSIGWITYAGSTSWIGEDGVASLHALTLNTSSVAENTAAGVLVGTLLGVTDGSTISITDTAGNRFALDGSTIETGATSTNFEAANSHNITVRETLDGYPNSPRDSVISITVTNVFEAASLNALTLDTNEVEEGTAAGTLVGTLQDVTSGSTLSLTDDADGRFVIDGEDIETGATPTDYDAATSHNITVRETLADSANSPRNSVIAITVTEAATAPAQFGSGNWSVADDETGGDITITITALPANGGSAITDLEYQLDGGSWVSLAGTTTGDYPVSGLTDDQEYDVAIRAVNAVGNGTASATKAVTPTAAFSPLDLTPTVWYDPSDLSSMFTDDGVTAVTTDGQAVYRINDKSGNAIHLRQTDATKRPLYKTDGTLHWLQFDGSNDFMVTGNIVPGTDKAQVFSGITDDGATTAIVYEFSANISTNAGSFYQTVNAAASEYHSALSRGTTAAGASQRSNWVFSEASGTTSVITGLHDIAGDSSIVRKDGVAAAPAIGDKGTGNFLTYPLYVGMRAGTSLPFNGKLYQLVLRFGAALTEAEIDDMETFVAGKTGTYPHDTSLLGVWTWFNSPRVLELSTGSLVVGGLYQDGGDVIAARYTGSVKEQIGVIHSNFELDDHDNPALFERADGKILALYSQHGSTSYLANVSNNVRDASAWGTATNLDSQLGHSNYSYANVIAMDSGRIYNIFRAVNTTTTDYAWHYSYTDTASGVAGWVTGVQISGDDRPYHHVRKNGANRIDFICNDGHPDITPTNGTYHFYMLDTAGVITFHQSDGTDVTANLPLSGADRTEIYNSSDDGRSWIWDVVIDGSGNPVVCFATYTTVSDVRYYQARWSGSAWSYNEVTTAGGSLYLPDAVNEKYYSGGIITDPNDVNTVYCSRKVDVDGVVDNTNGVHHLYRYVSADSGATWTGTRLTTGADKHFRPYIAEGTGDRLFYVKGEYTSYTDFDTTIESMAI